MKIDSPTAIGTSTGFGIPTGGTAGQMLIKNSSTNYDTSWITPTYGRTLMTIGTTISVVANSGGTVMEFTIPSSGVWEVNYNVRTRTATPTAYASIFLTDTSNTIITGSTTFLSTYFNAVSGQKQATNGAGQTLDVYVTQVPSGTLDFQLNTMGMDFLTTTGSTTYRIRMFSYAGTTQALSDSIGNTAVWYRKIG